MKLVLRSGFAIYARYLLRLEGYSAIGMPRGLAGLVPSPTLTPVGGCGAKGKGEIKGNKI